jgi:uncharacterized membrane protein YgdD (TMEM256/DUF423 family)
MSVRGATTLAVLGGIAGALGVALAAVAAHKVTEPGLVTAANMLMIHAAAMLAISAYARSAINPTFILASGFAMLVGIALFAGDIAASKLLGSGLFPMAAPIGGTLLIASWAAFALAAAVSSRRTD